jgi:hypothetical protein
MPNNANVTVAQPEPVQKIFYTLSMSNTGGDPQNGRLANLQSNAAASQAAYTTQQGGIKYKNNSRRNKNNSRRNKNNSRRKTKNHNRRKTKNKYRKVK